MLHQPGSLTCVQRHTLPVIASGSNQHKVMEQFGDVFLSLPQRRNIHFHHIQSVIKVGPEFSLVTQFLQIGFGGGDNTYVHVNDLVAAKPLNPLLLKNPEQFYLQRHGHTFQLIQEQGSPMSVFYLANTSFVSTCEGTGLVPEQLAFDQILGYSAAIDRNKIVAAAWTVFMDISGQRVLTGPRLTMKEHVCGDIQYRINGRHHPLHSRRIAQHPGAGAGKVSELSFQPPVLKRQMPFLKGMPQKFNQLLVIKRFLDEIVGTLLHGRYRRADIALTSQQNDRNIFINLPDALQHIQAVHARHVVITQDDALEIRMNLLQG